MLELLTDGLAAFRLTHLIVDDTFPPVAKARDRMFERYGPDHWFSYLISCHYCTGMWMAALVVFGLQGRRRLLARWLAVASIPPLIETAGFWLERQK